MLIDLGFIERHWGQVLALVVVVLVANTLLNGLLLRVLGRSSREGFYAAALLSQIGEFSFVLAAVGFQAGVITVASSQTTVAVIAIGLLISPMWIKLVKFALDQAEQLALTRQARPAGWRRLTAAVGGRAGGLPGPARSRPLQGRHQARTRCAPRPILNSRLHRRRPSARLPVEANQAFRGEWET